MDLQKISEEAFIDELKKIAMSAGAIENAAVAVKSKGISGIGKFMPQGIKKMMVRPQVQSQLASAGMGPKKEVQGMLAMRPDSAAVRNRPTGVAPQDVIRNKYNKFVGSQFSMA